MAAKVTLAPEFESMSGKLCNRNKSVIALNHKTGKMYRYDFHKSEDKNTTDQQTVRTAFTQRAKIAAAFWSVNKPKVGQPLTSAYKALKAAYDAQTEIGNIYGFLCSCIDKTTNKIMVNGKELTYYVPDEDGLGS